MQTTLDKCTAIAATNRYRDNWNEGRVVNFLYHANIRETALGTGYTWASLRNTKNTIFRLTDAEYMDLIENEVANYRALANEKEGTMQDTETKVVAAPKAAGFKRAKVTLEDLGIAVGSTLNSPKGVVKVVEGGKVETADGQVVSLSKAARLLSGYNSVSGFGYFSYNGKVLTDLRTR